MSLRSRKASDKFLTGREVRVWRLSRNLTQPELGKWLGLTPQAVARYEVVGVTKATALAFSAIDRGLKPVKLSKSDYKLADERATGKPKEGEFNE